MSRVDLRREPWLRASARRLAGSKEAHPARLTTTFEPPTVDHDVRPPITANLPAVSPRCPLTFKMRRRFGEAQLDRHRELVEVEDLYASCRESPLTRRHGSERP